MAGVVAAIVGYWTAVIYFSSSSHLTRYCFVEVYGDVFSIYIQVKIVLVSIKQKMELDIVTFF